MLNERDRRALREIEQQLMLEDPRFSSSLRGHALRHGRALRRARIRYDVTIAAAVVTAAICLALPGAAEAGAVAAMLAVAAVVARRLRFSRRGAPTFLAKLAQRRPRPGSGPLAEYGTDR